MKIVKIVTLQNEGHYRIKLKQLMLTTKNFHFHWIQNYTQTTQKHWNVQKFNSENIKQLFKVTHQNFEDCNIRTKEEDKINQLYISIFSNILPYFYPWHLNLTFRPAPSKCTFAIIVTFSVPLPPTISHVPLRNRVFPIFLHWSFAILRCALLTFVCLKYCPVVLP